jgi:electron transfer flavoprotein alpha subunit
MHHVVGMDQSKLGISINNNPKAEIFDVSDLIVVADFKKIVPRLIEAIRTRRKK